MREALLEMRGIAKEFPGVHALDNVDFDLYSGEVHCLVGENGAGKSTLIKILSGAYSKDKGTIFISGQEVEIRDPHHGRQLGVSVIYQELDLVPHLSAAENIFLGNEICGAAKTINWRKTRIEAKQLINSLGIDLPVDTPVRELKIAYQQFVAIARALSIQSRILVMDEPGAVLGGKELEQLFEIIHKLRQRGLGIIFISHRLAYVFELGDRVSILRDGKKVKQANVSEIGFDEVVRHMVGREIQDYYYKKKVSIGNTVLSVRNLNREGILHSVNLELRKGEILGISGLVGAGRTELARAIVGADRIDGGQIFLDGNEVSVKSPYHALKLGIGLVPEDRKQDGLLLTRSIGENISLTILRALTGRVAINFYNLYRTVRHFIEDLRIVATSAEQLAMHLSGGNQQKVVLAKWLASKCKILVLDEPTRGVDVGAKVEIYRLMHDLVKEGVSIVFISSELAEILSLSDRILVMSEGRITKELLPEQTNQEEVLQYSLPRDRREAIALEGSVQSQ